MIIKVREKERLELRTLVPGNADEVFEVIDRNRDKLRQWLPWIDGVYSPHNTGESIERWRNARKEKIDFTFGIFLGGNYIGNIGVHNVNRSSDSAQIGYWLSPEWQGKGIMTDCVRALTGYCFDELNLNSVHISCADANKKSRAVPERLNFVHEGVLQDCMKYHGVYYNEVIYGMVKRNWKSN
ncbi:MAG: GNAT family N-acetyltransferase [Oscillospiraceae bacterium]|nr:GNAT family N-acetyltransferase [Oscillospiraceae bacterium]